MPDNEVKLDNLGDGENIQDQGLQVPITTDETLKGQYQEQNVQDTTRNESVDIMNEENIDIDAISLDVPNTEEMNMEENTEVLDDTMSTPMQGNENATNTMFSASSIDTDTNTTLPANTEGDANADTDVNDTWSMEWVFDFNAVETDLRADDTGTENKVPVNFWYVTNKPKPKRNPNKIYYTFSRILIGVSSILLLVIIAGFFYLRYIDFSEKIEQTESEKKEITMMRDIIKMVDPYIDVTSIEKYGSTMQNVNDIEHVVSAKDLSYIDKKYLLGDVVKKSIQDFTKEKQDLAVSKRNITKYAYLSKEIDDIIWWEKTITSIEDSLFALETIKFNSAMNVFIYLDSFIKTLSKRVKVPVDTVKKKMQDILKKWETDINIYVKKCYLNPFEPRYDCNMIGDYDLYSEIFKKDTEGTVDRFFFKELIDFIDQKLERTNLPSFSIVFQTFNKNNDDISFTIDINTLRQDELELAKSWYLDPTTFIMKELINNLKRSKYVIWSNIKIDTLNVKEKDIKVGLTEFPVKTLSKSFTLPIQKVSEREIYDIIDER